MIVAFYPSKVINTYLYETQLPGSIGYQYTFTVYHWYFKIKMHIQSYQVIERETQNSKVRRKSDKCSPLPNATKGGRVEFWEKFFGENPKNVG